MTTSPTNLRLPAAPPVVRASPAPVRRRRAPALGLLALGVLLALGPVSGGLFAKVASGQQLIDAFAAHLEPAALDRYDADLAVLRAGAAGLDRVYDEQRIAEGRFPGVDAYRDAAGEIDARATALLARVRAAEPDYREVAAIGGFDRAPFLLVASGLAFAYAGAVLLAGRRQRAGGAVLLALAAAAALVGYPLVSDLPAGTRAGARLQDALAPVMTRSTVLAQQQDFVVLVHAVGELDTAFRDLPQRGQADNDVAALVAAWPEVSSDLAALVGAINDNLDNDRALADLDGLAAPLGLSGLVVFPWLLVGAGVVGGGAALAALPRTRKERR